MAVRLEPNARSIAAHVIERVEREGAFAAAVLDAAVERFPELDPRERALATELAYGARTPFARTSSWLPISCFFSIGCPHSPRCRKRCAW
jgi:hypothetical protein